jgi:hypothetical protein
MRTALALLLLASPAFSSSPLRLAAGPKAEDKLRRFVAGDKALRARLDDAMRREALFRTEARETGLKDAVADAAATREQLIAEMPGMKVPPAPTCPSLAECHQPEFSAVVDNPELLPDAVRNLMRPWLLLQEARGYKTEVAPSTKGDALMTATLKGLDASPLVLNVSPRLLGGFNVWFDEPARLGELYERERAAIFARK